MYKVFQILGMRKEKIHVDDFRSFTDAQVYADALRRAGNEIRVENTTRASGAFDEFEYECGRG